MARYTRRKIDENPERSIIMGMIVSDRVLKEIHHVFQSELIRTPFILTVSKWCMDYYQKFGKAPGVHIEDIFKRESEEGNLSDEEEELIVELLDSISDEYDRSENFNSAYLLDQAERYFESRNLKRRSTNVITHLKNSDLESAQKEFSDYKPVVRPLSMGTDPFTDREGMMEAFTHSNTPLFKLPGAAGRYLNDLMVRDSFVVLLGPEKRGKTWNLIELSMWARKSGCNTAFFSIGDMTKPQINRRFGIRFAGKSDLPKYCDEILYPVADCLKNQDDTCENRNRAGIGSILDEEGKLLSYEDEPDHEPCTFCRNNRDAPEKWEPSTWFRVRPPVKPLTWNEAADAGERLQRRWGKKARFKMESYPSGTLSIRGIESQLDLWEINDNFIPDVIILDYMDNICPDRMDQGQQQRHRIGDIWAGTRRISQERHCLVLSASQSDGASYHVQWINESHFSESKIKNAHVTGMVTLNQTIEEKRRNIIRFGKLLTREEEFDSQKGVTVLQCLKAGRSIIDSF